MTDKPKKPEGADANRFRSPPYPFISLPKAIERVKALHTKAQHHPVGMPVLADAWEYSAKSSGLIQTAAALLQFGLLTDEGSGEKRRFRLSHDALRIAQDADPLSEKLKAAIVRAALFPKIYKELWDKYGSSAGEIVLKNYLTLDRREAGQAPFSAAAAEDLINQFKATITYAELEKNVSLIQKVEGVGQDDNGDEKQKIAEGEKLEVSVGDIVQWESSGVIQFTERRVRAVADDRNWLFVEGSETGIPVEEVSIIKKGMPPVSVPPRLAEDTSIGKPLGFNKEITSLDEGSATLIWPEALSENSYYDLEHFLNGVLQKAKRRAGIT